MENFGFTRICVMICMIIMSLCITFAIGKIVAPEDDSLAMPWALSSLLSGIFITLFMWKSGII